MCPKSSSTLERKVQAKTAFVTMNSETATRSSLEDEKLSPKPQVELLSPNPSQTGMVDEGLNGNHDTKATGLEPGADLPKADLDEVHYHHDMDRTMLETGLGDLKLLVERDELTSKMRCDCRLCVDGRLSKDQESLFEVINDSRSTYLWTLERSLQKLHQKYKLENEEEENRNTSGSDGKGEKGDDQENDLIPDVARMACYEDEDGNFLESLLETEKPKAEKAKKSGA